MALILYQHPMSRSNFDVMTFTFSFLFVEKGNSKGQISLTVIIDFHVLTSIFQLYHGENKLLFTSIFQLYHGKNKLFFTSIFQLYHGKNKLFSTSIFQLYHGKNKLFFTSIFQLYHGKNKLFLMSSLFCLFFIGHSTPLYHYHTNETFS